VLVLVAVALAACNDLSGAPAARVGDAEISDEQLRADIPAFSFLVGLSGAPCGTPAAGESEDAACARFTLTNDIQEQIVKAYAAANGLAADPADVTAALDQLEQNLGGPEALDGQLEEAGLTRTGLRALAERLILFSEVQDAVANERLDDATLQSMYEGALTQFTTVEVSHILLEERRDAEQVARTVTPDTFGDVARDRSTDPGSADSGGSLGSYSEAQFRQQFDPTFVEAALALQPGEISGVVQTQFGFHVIELVRRDVASFEDVREQLSAQQAPQVFQEWLREQYGTLDIDVNPRYGRLNVETGEVVAIRSTADEDATTGASGPSGATGAAP
jgi:parvulin-like peptidyl-prolyl isomerase